MLTCGSPWLFAAYRVLLRQSVPWHPPCALVRLIFACYCYSPKTSTSTDTRCSLLPCQVRITTVFTLPISANSDWNLPWLQLKALFVFPTFSLCSFQGAISTAPALLKSRRSYAPAGSASRLSSCASQAFGLPSRAPVAAFEASSISLRSFKTIQYFIGVRNIRFVGSFEPLTAFRCLFVVSVPLFSYISSFPLPDARPRM